LRVQEKYSGGGGKAFLGRGVSNEIVSREAFQNQVKELFLKRLILKRFFETHFS
jgi:hypothetical protein